MDSALLLHYILSKVGMEPPSDSAINRLRSVYNDAQTGKKDIEIATSHMALGEILLILYEIYREDLKMKEISDALHHFNSIFDSDTYELLTPHPSNLKENIEKLIDKDRYLENNPSDCIMLAQAVSENMDKVVSFDKDWSEEIEELGIELEIYDKRNEI